MNYPQLAFTKEIKALQEQHGSRLAYERREKHLVRDGLTENEIRFISERDSFYLASYGENDFPYIQHRGGPKGFLQVIDERTLGFVDFTGNKQYISVGNISTHPNVSLILVSYPERARLKLYAKARIVAPETAPELFQQLDPADYPHLPERIILLDIQAYDWNCPQHITPRFTAEEVETAMASQRTYIEQLEAEIKRMKAK
ncbi:pyridoxamine 5'-phosphate oxidase family protein [Flavilitoribacter nigricans]|uniref:Pyridoxamine 5'-phosphate oxidase n=1 Tax=Flavilitoribacter nigricans (strain ATCC 23147 / DSM 23189 / NBRC 102662 / NCIMB 1420 / SS-2) TaxID=1122177 RepID=A0A2D0NGX4_FLAN2|nr:pyridoxamine 5'-phosphate oxidase family protein [Flavilitoribacter nigricans]PHN07745.1 pyridoxamine 5'-phosphate oxidase [Flavilitoribacter nigricans DSM 23189 = NBRC 102662]